ncbi:MAG: hypothetical protein F4029_11050 [Gammaproteobacteria bacterium]|nr:hypothetical protein [Gammaproteobacteria bacterium]MYK46750.1 hypothetical protein [Gammaproteobacteria bacterium]
MSATLFTDKTSQLASVFPRTLADNSPGAVADLGSPYNVTIRTVNSQQRFLAAFRDGDVESAKATLAQEPALHAHDGYAAHPLLRAGVAQNNGHCYRQAHLEIAELLLERGADPNLGPIKFMPSAAMAEAIPLLLRHGWDIDQGAGDRTLLHHDANHGHGAKVRILLAHGADPNVLDAAGRTPLHLLGARGTGRDAIRALARAGADLHVRDDAGHTPLDYARRAGQRSAERELLRLDRP